jgi:putative transposase
LPTKNKNQKEDFALRNKTRNVDESSLSHTRWNCMYHIVFIPKYRRKAIYGKLRRDIGMYLRRLCEYKKVEIIEANACIDHIHMLVRIPPTLNISQFMGYLKGKSALIIFDNHSNLKYKYGNRTFWAKGYYVSTVGLNKKRIQTYIQEQETEDKLLDKKTIKEHNDPFKG